MARIYQGYGGGTPLVYSRRAASLRRLWRWRPTCHCGRCKNYHSYGGGAPLATIVGNQVFHGYGGGQPLLTGEGCGLKSLAAAAKMA